MTPFMRPSYFYRKFVRTNCVFSIDYKIKRSRETRSSFILFKFACDVTAAMLVVKNNSLCLRWELNFIFMQIMQIKIVLFWPPTWPPCHVSEIKQYSDTGF